MAPGIKDKGGGLEAEPPGNFFDHAPLCSKKTPYFSRGLSIYARKGYKNERAKMKESRQNDREIKSTGR